MTVSIHQPCYWPWLGHFDRVRLSDLHIILDHVHITHGGKTQFANRNKIRTAQGWSWLTVPILTKGKGEDLGIDRIQIADGHWRRKHHAAINQSYGKSRFYRDFAAGLSALFAREWPTLCELCIETNAFLAQPLGIHTPMKRSSELGVPGSKEALVLNLCREVGATRYLSGPFGRDYLDLPAFAEAGIEVAFHDYDHPRYTQAYPGFEPYMSTLDLVLNHGAESRLILANEERAPLT